MPGKGQQIRKLFLFGIGLSLVSLLFIACGEDDEGEDTPVASPTAVGGGEATGATTPRSDTGGAATGATTGAASAVEITAHDYGYEGVPQSIAAGTVIEMTNASNNEAHQVVAIRLPDDEERNVAQILQALPEEGEGMLSDVSEELTEPSLVLIAGPGSDAEIALGDGTLNDSGRYMIACFVPEGADPQEVLDVVQEQPIHGEPPIDAPPHVALGMFAEVVVE